MEAKAENSPCKDCGQHLPLARHGRCKPCHRADSLRRLFTGTRVCVRCRRDLPRIMYTEHRLKHVDAECLDCKPKGSLPRPYIEGAVYPCGICNKDLPVECFDKVRSASLGVAAYGQCGPCKRKRARELYRRRVIAAGGTPQPIGEAEKRQDAEYDYAFARDVLGFSPGSATEWVVRGYRMNPESVRRWALHRKGLVWKPDPIAA